MVPQDSVLITDFLSGNNASFEVLLNRYKNRVYGFVYSKVNDANLADDIFQDTFVKVVKTLRAGSYKEEGRFLSWVLRIAHNLIVDHYRKSNRMPKYESSREEYDVVANLSDDNLNAEFCLIENQIHADLVSLIKELPDTQQEVILMRLYKDMSFKDIADNTGVSINTALGRMRYAVINLRKLIEERNLIFTQ
ncbi:MAG: sigma-70 family RNA polymerase sigma factor [Flavobacteriaceae bacterium]|nr:sigma-70 family RNA polymerase sigma factor [Flavobacteriaceae bacterium]